MNTESETFPPVGPNHARVLLYCPQEIPEARDPALYFYRKPDGVWALNIGESKSLPPRAVVITRAQLVEFLATCGIPDDHEHPGIDTNMLVSIHLASRAENAIEAIQSEPEAGSRTPERLADIRRWAAQDFDFEDDPVLAFKLLMMLREVLGDFLPEDAEEEESDFPSGGSQQPYWHHSDEGHWQLMRGDVELGYVLHCGPLGTVPGGWRVYRCVEGPGMSEEQVLGSYGTAALAKDALWDEIVNNEEV